MTREPRCHKHGTMEWNDKESVFWCPSCEGPTFLRDVVVPAWVLGDLMMAADQSPFRRGADEAIAHAKVVMGKLPVVKQEAKHDE